VGHADRSAYDLTVHAAESKARLTAFVSYDKPVMKKVLAVKLDKGKIGKTFKGAAQAITKFLESREEADLKKLQERFAAGYVAVHFGPVCWLAAC
jgi:glycyl-tRNA synthetase